MLARYNLNDRQIKAVSIMKTTGKINNKEYREQAGVTIRTASRDLEELVDKRVLEKVGTTGRNTYYVLARNQDTK
jgi:ATP-dependent DNA helicase RecG